MVMSEGLMSSDKDDWRTPIKVFNEIDKEHGPFTLDAAADDKNHLCDEYFTMDDDALKQKWSGIVWVNPPYGRIGPLFVRKAWIESEHCKVVMLIPARPDTSYWHKYILDDEGRGFQRGVSVRFWPGRIKFTNPNSSNTGAAPFPAAVVVFDREVVKKRWEDVEDGY